MDFIIIIVLIGMVFILLSIDKKIGELYQKIGDFHKNFGEFHQNFGEFNK